MYRVLVSALILSGCATGMYVHEGKTDAQFEVDKYECQKVAEQRTANNGVAGNIFLQADYEKECMTIEKGWGYVQ